MITRWYRLLALGLTVSRKEWLESFRVARRYFSSWRFVLSYLWLKMSYLLDDPFRVSRRYLKSIQSDDLYAYGDTPLTTLDKIMTAVSASPHDHVVELGAGSGFTSLWLHCYLGCTVTAIERIPTFCWRLMRTARRVRLKGINVQCNDYLKAEYDQASIIYLYGSNLDDETLLALTQRFQRLSAGVKIITVSYSLLDYCQFNGQADGLVVNNLIVENTLQAEFPWGAATVFIHRVEE